VAAALAAAACGPTSRPDEQRGPESVYWGETTPLPNVLDALDLIGRRAKSECPALAWCAEVYFSPGPTIPCGSIQANGGCQPYGAGCTVEVVWHPVLSQTALADELGHYVWEVCRGRTGERILDDGRTQRDPDFDAWVRDVDADLAALEAIEAADAGPAAN